MADTRVFSIEDRDSIAFCNWLFAHVSGRALTRVCGDLPYFNAERSEIGISPEHGTSLRMPASALLTNLAFEEIEFLDSLPAWTGNNEYQLSSTLITTIHRAIRRHSGTPFSWDEAIEGPKFTGSAYFLESIHDGRIVRTAADL